MNKFGLPFNARVRCSVTDALSISRLQKVMVHLDSGTCFVCWNVKLARPTSLKNSLYSNRELINSALLPIFVKKVSLKI